MEYSNYTPFTLVSLPFLIVHGFVAFTLQLAFGLSVPIQFNIVVKRVEERCRASYHPRSNLF